jgi:HK97 family phage prohead protease
MATATDRPMIRKVLASEVQPRRTGFTARITTETVDEDGEVLIPAGMDATYFEKVKTVFWDHDIERPIGRTISKLRRSLDGVEAEVEWAVRPKGYQGEWFPDFARGMVEQGVVSSVSVGFRVLPDGMRTATDGDVAKWGTSCRKVINRWQLYEFSVTPAPCNSAAVITSVQKHLLTPKQAADIFRVNVNVPERPARHYILLT